MGTTRLPHGPKFEWLTLIVGVVWLSVPPIFWWYMSDADRQVALIAGQSGRAIPWGSAPFQLFVLGLFPVLLGLTAVFTALAMFIRRRSQPVPRPLTLAKGLLVALSAGVGLLVIVAAVAQATVR